MAGRLRRGRLPLRVPEVDASAALGRRERPMRESTGLGGELEAPGIVLVALPQLGQPAAIGRLIPLGELVRAVAAGQRRGGSRLRCRGARRCHSQGVLSRRIGCR